MFKCTWIAGICGGESRYAIVQIYLQPSATPSDLQIKKIATLSNYIKNCHELASYVPRPIPKVSMLHIEILKEPWDEAGLA